MLPFRLKDAGRLLALLEARGSTLPAGSGIAGMARDAASGVVASLVTLAHCLSFSALVFAGDLSPGLPMALWGFMLATAVVTLLSGSLSTLPPIGADTV